MDQTDLLFGGPGMPPQPWIAVGGVIGGAISYDGAIMSPKNVPGGPQGPGTLNVNDLYIQGVRLQNIIGDFLPITGGTLTGPLILSGPNLFQLGFGQAGQVLASDGANNTYWTSTPPGGPYLLISGGTLTGSLTLSDNTSLLIGGGAPGQVLQTDGNSNLTWVNPGGAGSLPPAGTVGYLLATDGGDNPYWTNVLPGGPYAPAVAGGYLPLSGGTVTGPLTINAITKLGPAAHQSIFDNNGSLGIGTIPPVNQSPPNTSISGLPGAGGAWAFSWGLTTEAVVNNLYYDGSNWRLWQNGLGSYFAINNGSFIFGTIPSGNADDIVSIVQTASLDHLGNFLITGILKAVTIVSKPNSSGMCYLALTNAADTEWGGYFAFNYSSNDCTLVNQLTGGTLTLGGNGILSYNNSLSLTGGITTGNSGNSFIFNWDPTNWGVGVTVNNNYILGNYSCLTASFTDSTYSAVRAWALNGAAGLVYAWYAPSGAWSWPQTGSDIRLKSHIEPANKDALAAINQISVIECDLTMPFPNAKPQHWNWAIIADDKLEAAVPISVVPAEEHTHAIIRELPMIAALVKAVQQLTKSIDLIKAENKQAMLRIANLESQLKAS